jgi:hypothetical protein
MRVGPAEPRRIFSIYLPDSLYQKLLNKAGKGKINTFINEVLEEKFAGSGNKLAQEYQECYSNPRMIKEAKQ